MQQYQQAKQDFQEESLERLERLFEKIDSLQGPPRAGPESAVTWACTARPSAIPWACTACPPAAGPWAPGALIRRALSATVVFLRPIFFRISRLDHWDRVGLFSIIWPLITCIGAGLIFGLIFYAVYEGFLGNKVGRQAAGSAEVEVSGSGPLPIDPDFAGDAPLPPGPPDFSVPSHRPRIQARGRLQPASSSFDSGPRLPAGQVPDPGFRNSASGASGAGSSANRRRGGGPTDAVGSASTPPKALPETAAPWAPEALSRPLPPAAAGEIKKPASLKKESDLGLLPANATLLSTEQAKVRNQAVEEIVFAVEVVASLEGIRSPQDLEQARVHIEQAKALFNSNKYEESSRLAQKVSENLLMTSPGP